jgi:D-alanyl-D-alanine carboxypeptidase
MKATKRIFILLISLLLAIPLSLPCKAEGRLSLSAESAVLVSLEDGRVLYEKDHRKRMGPASTTKIMTALTVLRYASPEETVTVSAEAVGTEGSSVYLCLGERLTVEQLLYALLLSSANDAAVALAIHVSGSIEGFAEKMNGYAAELGLADTHFTNPHGLCHSDHYTTALDLALITREAMGNGLLRSIFATYKATIPFDGEPDQRLLVNHNKLLRSYEGAIGVKTGYTKATGRTLVSAAERDGLTLIAVTLNAPDDWRDHKALLDHGFEHFENRTVYDVGEFEYSFPIVGGISDTVTLTNTVSMSAVLPKGSSVDGITVSSCYRFAFAPLKCGALLGEVEISIGDVRLHSPLALSERADKISQKRSIFDRLGDIFNKGTKKWQS